MKNKKWLFVSIFILLLITTLIIIEEDQVNIETKEEKNFYPSVSIMEIEAKKHKGKIKVFSEIKPRWFVDLKAHVSGKVLELNKNALEGKRVKKGEVLLKIESSRYKNQLDEAYQYLEEAELELLLEKKKSNTALNDWKLSKIEQKLTDLALNLPQIKIAQKKLQSAKSRVIMAKKDLEYTIIEAPFSGFLTKRSVNLGQTISQGDSLFEILDDQTLDIVLSLGEKQWDLIDKDFSKNEVKIFNEKNKKIASGKLSHGGEYIDPTTRQYKLFIELSTKDNLALAGEFVNVHIQGKEFDNVLKIPQSAYTRDGIVWYVDEKNKLQNFQGEILFYMDKWLIVKKPNLASNSFKIALNPLSSFIESKLVEPKILKSSN